MKSSFLTALALLISAPAWAGSSAPPGVPLSAVGVAGGVAPTDANARLPISKSYSVAPYRFIGTNNFVGSTEANHSSANEYGETTRTLYTATRALTHLDLFLPAQTAFNGFETNTESPVFYYAAVEYPLNSNSKPPMFTLNGQTQMEVGTQGSGTFTDPLGLNIPAGAQFAIRYGTYVSRAPASVTLAVSAGGSLAAGTTYYYEVTSVINGLESGPTAEYSAATTSGNQTITLTIAVPPNSFLGYQNYRIYRSATTGAETYLGNVAVPGVTFVDNGAVPATTVTPPYSAYHYYAYNDSLETGDSTNSPAYGGGNGINQVSGTNVLYGVGPSNVFVSRPYVLGDAMGGFSVCGFGDSIEAGFTFQGGNIAQGLNPVPSSWFGLAMIGNNIDFLNESIPTTTLASIVTQGPSYGSSTRLNLSRYCQYLWSNLGTNDIYANSTSGQQVASWQLQIAQSFYQRGQRYYVTTLLPRVTTADHVITLGGQTFVNGTNETSREWYNNWVRDGMQVLAGAPVLSGGTPTTYISGYFDIASALGEVNSSGVPTPNGGYWPVPSAPSYTGQVLTGTPSTSSLPVGGAAYTVNGLAGDAVKMTSGAANGQTAIIQSNTATSIAISSSGGLTNTPAAGDTFSVYPIIGFDGIHPSALGHANIGAGQNGNIGSVAWAAANFTGF